MKINGPAIATRSELAEKLKIGKLVKLNKEREQPFATMLEMIVDHLISARSAVRGDGAGPKPRPSINVGDLSARLPADEVERPIRPGTPSNEGARPGSSQGRRPPSPLTRSSDSAPAFPLEPVSSLPGTPLGPEKAAELAILMFGTTKRAFPEEWQQGFFFNVDDEILRYGLVQLKGGSCGIIASVQAYVLKELLFGSHKTADLNSLMNPDSSRRSGALIAALTEILWQAGHGSATVLLSQVQGGSLKQRFRPAEMMVNTFQSQEALHKFLTTYIEQFSLPHGNGILQFLYSLCLTHGINNIIEEMDDAKNTLVGRHGYCTQEMVNLILIGRSVSNVFDGDKDVDGLVLKGVHKRGPVGFLSLFEKYKMCEVGARFKDPVHPIWVMCNESHFTVIFSSTPIAPAAKTFDLFYYDQLGAQQEEYKLTVDMSGRTPRPVRGEDDMVPPIEDTITTKWPHAVVDWNGSDPLL
eukprot:TRINITY_DN3005_c0_g1_i3.p1 TRINITY_DN3005_c0_g1~~TRINITY_DN3005_c0_g1_i3.p1  ORF type:complete len:526 (+),score=159.39 TRINITY_DN3005_c0_g1_i3:173-1579(+)